MECQRYTSGMSEVYQWNVRGKVSYITYMYSYVRETVYASWQPCFMTNLKFVLAIFVEGYISSDHFYQISFNSDHPFQRRFLNFSLP